MLSLSFFLLNSVKLYIIAFDCLNMVSHTDESDSFIKSMKLVYSLRKMHSTKVCTYLHFYYNPNLIE